MSTFRANFSWVGDGINLRWARCVPSAHENAGLQRSTTCTIQSKYTNNDCGSDWRKVTDDVSRITHLRPGSCLIGTNDEFSSPSSRCSQLAERRDGEFRVDDPRFISRKKLPTIMDVENRLFETERMPTRRRRSHSRPPSLISRALTLRRASCCRIHILTLKERERT